MREQQPGRAGAEDQDSHALHPPIMGFSLLSPVITICGVFASTSLPTPMRRDVMRKVNQLARLALLSSLALLSIVATAPASAAGNLDAHLRGSYAFTTARTCTNSSSPINPPAYLFTTGVFRQASSDKGIMTFNGDGTGSSVGTSTTMDISAPSGPLVTVSTFTSTFDYTVNADGTVDTITTSNPFESIFGRGAGDTGTVSGQRGRLQISHGNTMLVSAPSGTFAVETVEIHPASGGTVTRYRICVRSGTLTMLPGK